MRLSLNRFWPAIGLMFAVLSARGAELELLRVAKISTSTAHCAFTGLTRYNDTFFCTWREGAGHVSGDGRLRVVRSADGTNWTSVALIARAGVDLRDSKIEVTPDNRLMSTGRGKISVCVSAGPR